MMYKVGLICIRIASGVLIFMVVLLCTNSAFTWWNIEFIPRVLLREEYDSNVTSIQDNPAHDIITKLGLGVEAKQEGKTNSLYADLNVAFHLFAYNSSLNNFSEKITLRCQQALSKYDHVILEETFTHSEEPLSFEDEFGRINGRYSTYRNRLSVDYIHDFTPQLAGKLRYNHETSGYARRDLSNSYLHTAEIGIEYAINSATLLRPGYYCGYRSFESGCLLKEKELTIQLRRYLTSQLYFDLQTGADFILSCSGKLYSRPLFGASITNDLDDTTQGELSFEKKYSTTPYVQDPRDGWRVSLDFAKEITDRVHIKIGAFHGSGNYVATGIAETFSGVDIEGSYVLARLTYIHFNYIYLKGDTSETTGDYTKNIVGLAITSGL